MKPTKITRAALRRILNSLLYLYYVRARSQKAAFFPQSSDIAVMVFGRSLLPCPRPITWSHNILALDLRFHWPNRFLSRGYNAYAHMTTAQLFTVKNVKDTGGLIVNLDKLQKNQLTLRLLYIIYCCVRTCCEQLKIKCNRLSRLV